MSKEETVPDTQSRMTRRSDMHNTSIDGIPWSGWRGQMRILPVGIAEVGSKEGDCRGRCSRKEKDCREYPARYSLRMHRSPVFISQTA